jgi:hypothetical protein
MHPWLGLSPLAKSSGADSLKFRASCSISYGTKVRTSKVRAGFPPRSDRADLVCRERTRVARRIADRSRWGMRELAKKEGKSKSWIEQRIRFGRF